LERSELDEKYERVERDEARRWWEAEYAQTPATEARRFHILGGAIFPIYDKIMGSSGIHNVKIARAMLVDGRAWSVRLCLVALLPRYLLRHGLSEEIINYKRRWFVVLDEAATIMPHLLVQRRAMRGIPTMEPTGDREACGIDAARRTPESGTMRQA
jgi:hypothetical protein